jgi:hypothetical protein
MLGNFSSRHLSHPLAVFAYIFAISAIANTKPVSGWYVQMHDGAESRLLHPNCFTVEWMSSDNFEEYEEVFNIQRKDFRQSPGRSFGKEITNYHPIKPSWNKNGFISHETISLIQSVKSCAPESFTYSVVDDGSIHTIAKTDFGEFEQKYRVLDPIDTKECSSLAPNIGSTCLQAFKVRIGEYSGGSMGWDFRQGIYGLFDIEGMGPSVVPLTYYLAD